MGLVAGMYPAFYLSALSPVNALKNIAQGSGTRLRQILIVAQFAIAILLLVATDVVYRQLDYLQRKDHRF